MLNKSFCAASPLTHPWCTIMEPHRQFKQSLCYDFLHVTNRKRFKKKTNNQKTGEITTRRVVRLVVISLFHWHHDLFFIFLLKEGRKRRVGESRWRRNLIKILQSVNKLTWVMSMQKQKTRHTYMQTYPQTHTHLTVYLWNRWSRGGWHSHLHRHDCHGHSVIFLAGPRQNITGHLVR